MYYEMLYFFLLLVNGNTHLTVQDLLHFMVITYPVNNNNISACLVKTREKTGKKRGEHRRRMSAVTEGGKNAVRIRDGNTVGTMHGLRTGSGRLRRRRNGRRGTRRETTGRTAGSRNETSGMRRRRRTGMGTGERFVTCRTDTLPHSQPSDN